MVILGPCVTRKPCNPSPVETRMRQKRYSAQSVACRAGFAVIGLWPASVFAAGLSFVLELPGDAEQTIARYECSGESELRTVTYVNAAPNFLAIMDIEGETHIMASVIAGSGVRYVSGQYVWHTKGPEATLGNELDGPDADPLTTCLQATSTP